MNRVLKMCTYDSMTFHNSFDCSTPPVINSELKAADIQYRRQRQKIKTKSMM